MTHDVGIKYSLFPFTMKYLFSTTSHDVVNLWHYYVYLSHPTQHQHYYVIFTYVPFIVDHYIITLVMNVLLILCVTHNWHNLEKVFHRTELQLQNIRNEHLDHGYVLKIATTITLNHIKAHSCLAPRWVDASNDNDITHNWFH